MAKQTAVERTAAAAAAFGDAAEAVDQAVADHFGVTRTEFRILAAVHAGGPVSAGAISAAVTLSPAATTEAVQRLVARGVLVRGVDPGDRRRALITVVPEVAERIDALYLPIRDEGFALLAGYTPAELTLIADVLERGSTLQLDAAARIRAQALPTTFRGATSTATRPSSRMTRS